MWWFVFALFVFIMAAVALSISPTIYKLATDPQARKEAETKAMKYQQGHNVTVLNVVDDWGPKCVFSVDDVRYTTFDKCLYSKGDTIIVRNNGFFWRILN